MNFALRHTGDLSRVWSASHPMEAGLSPSSPWELNKQSGWMNGEVNGCSYGCLFLHSISILLSDSLSYVIEGLQSFPHQALCTFGLKTSLSLFQ